ncbi:serine phosphatase RsbU (regulator of sigma subunit) [Mycolicibacterium sp. BK556]|uniref:PP2C family protein-serine/threonine phosphatase n=1 Tax=Mycobacteriaceae TaxID=1762 RepID=UPI00105EF2C0|nr:MULTISPECIES: SpoIIE family protein phosphatase [Mycobacteriaceae]MBB3604802.1 serine phosphatase RsbU (regulator of sigma subunit) [Mycolicibacterium sp. BK556]MBB3634485.1 serine phosphatase RsbU (regulator of sigma subunit) [Mycolicibacterium sp. BK607]MBB3752062.1 serine phosphatase RsbU (regulator of sigma subunit) [Mycolicibacterium sp. BK634]TDO17691.1 serine phosphatase [Mycobacterium sp. BK086]
MANESIPDAPPRDDDVEFALNGSLNLRRTVLKLLTTVRPALADWAVVAMPDHRTGGLALYGGANVGFSAVISRSSVTERGLDQVLRTGQRVHRLIGTDESAADISGRLRHAGLATELAGLRPVDVLVLPLIARGTTTGVLVLARTAGRHFDDDSITEAERMAATAAVALDSARSYEERGQLAAVLQRTLRPPKLPQLSGFRVAARYRPAVEHLEVGGDFYDVIGTDDDLLATLGDVCGKGVDSAALTLQARQTVRTAAHFDRRPASVLDALNSVLCEQRASGFVTALCARVRSAPDGAEADIAAAGHPAPILIRADGNVEQVEVAGIATGVKPGVVYRPATVRLQQGDTMLMFTDGVEEARRDERFYGVPRLLGILPAYAGAGGDVICEAVERDVLEYLDGDPHDDIALLAVTCER